MVAGVCKWDVSYNLAQVILCGLAVMDIFVLLHKVIFGRNFVAMDMNAERYTFSVFAQRIFRMESSKKCLVQQVVPVFVRL